MMIQSWPLYGTSAKNSLLRSGTTFTPFVRTCVGGQVALGDRLVRQPETRRPNKPMHGGGEASPILMDSPSSPTRDR
jgi:hypothetical protein